MQSPVGSNSATRSLLVTTSDGNEYEYVLNVSEVDVGRSPECAIRVPSGAVSRVHARIALTPDGATVADRESTNGTYLNDKRIGSRAIPLRAGDRLRIGDAELRYVVQTDDGSVTEEPSEEAATRLVTSIAKGNFHTLLLNDPSLLSSPQAEQGLLRVVVSDRSPRFAIREGNTTREIALTSGKMVIGRTADADIRLRDPHVSSKHATVAEDSRGLVLRDLGSSNGLRVNGIVATEHVLHEGDTIRIGSVSLVFIEGGGRSSSPPPAGRRRPVVLVPGFGASELFRGKTKVWPSILQMLTTPADKLTEYWRGELDVGRMVREAAVIPGFTKADTFAWVVEYLTRDLGYRPNEDLLEFPYDWRGDIPKTAQLLDRTIARWRASRDRPTERVTLVGHSMGGLVCRLYLGTNEGVDAVRRCVFLGTPHRGSVASISVAVAGHKREAFGLQWQKVRRIALEIPSFYQLFPAEPWIVDTAGSAFDPFREDDRWLPAESRDFMQRARTFRRSLDALGKLPVPATSVFGYQQKTIERMRIRQLPSGELEKLELVHAQCGDGMVVESSAILPGTEIHPVVQQHGALYSDPDVLRRLRYELVERKD